MSPERSTDELLAEIEKLKAGIWSVYLHIHSAIGYSTGAAAQFKNHFTLMEEQMREALLKAYDLSRKGDKK
jgi:hypothetical protein